MVVFYAHMTWSLLVSFAYRWYVLHYEASIRKLYMLFLIGLIYIPMIVEYCIVVKMPPNCLENITGHVCPGAIQRRLQIRADDCPPRAGRQLWVVFISDNAI